MATNIPLESRPPTLWKETTTNNPRRRAWVFRQESRHTPVPRPPGVTGRYGATGYGRLRPGITARAGISSTSEPAVTGYNRLPPGSACVEGVGRRAACFDNAPRATSIGRARSRSDGDSSYRTA
jgi:hypothetical protein